ncbi:hypothetical protein SAMN05660368_03714 [Marvinbryantia formatexigens]|nr:hypothetical protein SAMN05660368_03714 [Marvinbryantia formatexigens]
MGAAKICNEADPEKTAEECASRIMRMSGKDSIGQGECASGSRGESGCGLTEQGDDTADGKTDACIEHKGFAMIMAENIGAFRVGIEHIAGAPAVSVSVSGKRRDVFDGIANLLEHTAFALTGENAAEAVRIVEVICKAVKKDIMPEGDADH